MKKKSRIVLAVICLSMAAVYFLPVWSISLDAPQYPEGLGFEIWIHSMSGDLNTVNGLNHYIGMKLIKPDSITELKIMPYILGFLILSGIFVSFLGKIKMFVAWVVLFILLGVAGGVDFWMWEYDYGHDLNPAAAIKVPGMTYQPPLIGSKELLNFTAYSYPAAGGYILILCGMFSVLISVYEIRINSAFRDRRTKKLS